MSETQENASKSSATKKHAGGCHCGAVRFEVLVDTTSGSRCNCSVCTKTSVLGGSVKPAAFTLLSGAESLSEYEWGHKISRRFFCKHCGVHCFARGHLEQIGGDFVSICINTVDGVEFRDLKVTYWDGRHDNWHAGPRSAPWPIVPIVTMG